MRLNVWCINTRETNINTSNSIWIKVEESAFHRCHRLDVVYIIKKIIRHQIPTTINKKDIWDCVQLVSYLSISYNLSAMEFILFLIIAVIIFLICALCKSGKRKPMFSGEFSLLLISHEMHLGFANHLLIQWFIKFSFHTKFIQTINACIFQFSFVDLSIGWWCKEIRPLLYCIHGK